MDGLMTPMYVMFREVHGRMAKDSTEVVNWALNEGLLTPDEYGACCIAGLVRDYATVTMR